MQVQELQTGPQIDPTLYSVIILESIQNLSQHSQYKAVHVLNENVTTITKLYMFCHNHNSWNVFLKNPEQLTEHASEKYNLNV